MHCMTIAARLRSRLEETGESQAGMARRLGMTPQTLNAILQGNIKTPEAPNRRAIAQEFGIRHVDVLVICGEITEDEIASVAPRWPTGEPKHVKAFGIVEGLPDAAMDYTLRTLRMIRDADWTPTP